MPKTRKVAVIQETARKLWFRNIYFPIAMVGYLVEPLFFKLYKNVEFITASKTAVTEVAKMGINMENIHLVYHGVDRGVVRAEREKEPTVLYLGLLTKDKGFEDACAALTIVKKRIPNLNFWIAGKEGKKGNFNWYVGQARSFAKYFGFVNEAKKFQLYSKAWILVHPSEREGWGLTVVEAATQGTPTVGYDVPGLRDSILNGKTGLLCDQNPQNLAEKIIELLDNKTKYRNLSKGALAWSRKFNWETSGRNSWKLINEVLK